MFYPTRNLRAAIDAGQYRQILAENIDVASRSASERGRPVTLEDALLCTAAVVEAIDGLSILLTIRSEADQNTDPKRTSTN